ncbi:hypothetical protein L1286_18815 [Pseudoalteromonas sp. SMS1]|uniref:hypothetical protein n=1 Tax=Pseudoalteromonas sp. SMS1 TaxID=2908894 RepID=UPI001F20D14E|nr:hypothetical protein [Pseudoalteromonas sp. SMS1]MCF2859538.1 hypothetical protein [Pseudoalteromonas sp. SMS1]
MTAPTQHIESNDSIITNFIATVDRNKLAHFVTMTKDNGALSRDDAQNNMRDMNTLLSTAAGTALAKFLESGDTKYLEALTNLNEHAQRSLKHFISLYHSVNEAE